MQSSAPISALTPLNSNTLLSALHRQLNHPNPHPRLLRLHNNFLLALDRSHDVLVVVHIRTSLASKPATPKSAVLTLRIVELLLGEELAVVFLRLNAVRQVVRFDASEELVDLRVFAVL